MLTVSLCCTIIVLVIKGNIFISSQQVLCLINLHGLFTSKATSVVTTALRWRDGVWIITLSARCQRFTEKYLLCKCLVAGVGNTNNNVCLHPFYKCVIIVYVITLCNFSILLSCNVSTCYCSLAKLPGFTHVGGYRFFLGICSMETKHVC